MATLSNQQQALVKQFCYGTLRWYSHLKLVASFLIYKPLPAHHQDIHCLLLLGLYQLIHLHKPVYAAVSETVSACQALKKPWAKGLINQALRKFINHSQDFLQKAADSEEALFSHPQWFIKLLKVRWPQQWQSILEANNTQAPMFLRVNLQQITLKQYLLQLQHHQIPAFPVEDFPQAIYLNPPQGVESLPGFEQGLCSVQDLASQKVAELLNIKPNQRILDACAAPGGKTSHLLELQPRLTELVAVDQNPARIEMLVSNVERLKLEQKSLRVIVGDASLPKSWWDGQFFDRILVDAPCSATGVIRRHPDIKILRQETDILVSAKQQLALLEALWPLLTPNGLLLYTTCSILPEENEYLIVQFCQKHADAHPLPVNMSLGFAQKIGHQLLPTINGSDGFYYALLNKTNTSRKDDMK